MNQPMRGFAGVLLAVSLACATGGSPKTESTTAPGADIPAHRSFTLQPAAGAPGAAAAPLSILDANVENAIRAKLVEKGYREVAENPDLRITFETSAYIAEKEVSSPMRIGLGVGSFGGPVGVGVGTSAPVGPSGVKTSQETRLSIRAVDPKQNKEVWVGTTTGIANKELDASGVAKVVAATLADFPARPK